MGRRLRGLIGGGLVLLLAPSASAEGEDMAAEETPTYRFGFEIKGHMRDSDAARFPSPFPFGDDMIPPGQEMVFLETVDAGSHTELSVVTLWLEARWRPWLSAKLKLDLVDRYDRNPTSSDHEYDLDEAWLRFGWETDPGRLPEKGWNPYLKIGELPKFERQDDRHLESYGLVATATNRFEDAGLEAGVDLGRRFYLKASFTQGNPVFFRDPNALAGDNGTEIFDGSVTNPESDLKSGILIIYETDIEDYDFAHPEFGFGIGARFGDPAGRVSGDVLAWAYGRELADTVDLNGTFYGGDLDFLMGPLNLFPLVPITGDEKNEWGANLWLYAGDLTFFGQILGQDIAGLRREGWEAEVSWAFDLPYFAGFAGRQLLPYVAPAVRYSQLDPDFGTGELPFPAPSVFWDWEKIDIGLRIGILEGLDVTVEWNDNTFVRAGRDESADEFLATVRWEMDWER